MCYQKSMHVDKIVLLLVMRLYIPWIIIALTSVFQVIV